MAAHVTLGPAKLVLLAVHLATIADIDSLTYLIGQHAVILRPELVLRIILTYLPETLSPAVYVPLIQSIASGESPSQTNSDYHLDTSSVRSITEEQASRKVKKLHLLSLKNTDVPLTLAHEADPFTSFLLLRAYRMDEEAGMLPQVPDLVSPFLQQSQELHTWMISTVLPLVRRNYEYYPQRPIRYSLLEFQNLPARMAIDYLLAETGAVDDEFNLAGRDLSGLVGPWLHDESRWKREAFDQDVSNETDAASELSCPGWEQALEWLASKAATSWPVALKAIESWDGPSDIDLGNDAGSWLQENQQQYLDRSYARAVLASAYLISDADAGALEAAFRICNKIRSLLDEDSDITLQSAVENLTSVPPFDMDAFGGAKAATYLRNDLLQSSNPITTPKEESLDLLPALIQSAYLLTHSGAPCTVRKAGDLAFIQDQQEQKSQISRLIRNLPTRASEDDGFWIRARKEILWLHGWGNSPKATGDETLQGIFGNVTLEFIETELLKAMLSHSRYNLARTLYDQEGPDAPLSVSAVLNTAQNAALGAFDNASNPNRNRGGLKRCDEIKRIEALLKATHALSDYRLVLKQGEPFSPVVLRVHSDPVSIIEKVLEQNPKAYTRLQEFEELGNNMIHANLPICVRPGKQQPIAEDQDTAKSLVTKRIVAMCIEAALREDDFETAYSYVVTRLGADENVHKSQPAGISDEWSWKAALDAGKYVRTERSQKPTHLGTASGNPEIRHLEQRIECLATSLRIAPPSQLQEVLKTFRRCEEQLDAAIKEEAVREAAWDTAGDLSGLPGSFDTPGPDKAYPPRNISASATARQAEEAPMSLFDLSRATARVASRNLTVLSSLQGSFTSDKTNAESESSEFESHEQNRTRKRDQLREAATGTLVSGVGWLLGANPNRPTSGQQ
ncbi:transport sec39 [Fusarium subglutinans]|uniref:Transport sec39 n=1 Tax=Gibberella subglutinans TaxID=42677 RepID=A0A8H5L4I1_GIBSU|nr:transport sec39 [Fusarium subglutinans]KAF5586229.1 transport sec39 [Fusarium subglutinans]